MKACLSLLPIQILLLILPFQVYAEEGDISFGMYGNIVGTSGKPSNDVLGIGIIGSYQLKDSWFVDVELIQSEADFERPWRVLGLVQDESVLKTVDAIYSSTVVMAQIGQNINSGSVSYDWYWSAGLGFNSIDVDDASGPLVGGGTFNIKTDASTETLIGLKAGIKQHLSDNWNINYGLRINYHFADWTVTDTVSNTTAKIDNYGLYGILVGVERKF